MALVGRGDAPGLSQLVNPALVTFLKKQFLSKVL